MDEFNMSAFKFQFFSYILSGFMARAFKFQFFFFLLSGFTLSSLIIHSIGFGPFNFADYPHLSISRNGHLGFHSSFEYCLLL